MARKAQSVAPKAVEIEVESEVEDMRSDQEREDDEQAEQVIAAQKLALAEETEQLKNRRTGSPRAAAKQTADSNALKPFTAVYTVMHQSKAYHPGHTILLTEKQASRLLDQKAISRA